VRFWTEQPGEYRRRNVALMGLIVSIKAFHREGRWTAERREKFLAAFHLALDFVYPVQPATPEAP
jgi:hypothetical protein